MSEASLREFRSLSSRWYARAEALISRAVALDRAGRSAEACTLYREAAAGVLAGVRHDARGDAITVPAVRRANEALDRVAELEAQARQREQQLAAARQQERAAPARAEAQRAATHHRPLPPAPETAPLRASLPLAPILPAAVPQLRLCAAAGRSPSSLAAGEAGAVLHVGVSNDDARAERDYAAARRAALAAPGRRFLDADFVPDRRALGRGAELEVTFAGTGRVAVPILWRRPEELVDEAGLAAAGSSLDIARDLELLSKRRNAEPADGDSSAARAPPASHLSFLLEQARIHRANRGGVYPPRGGASGWCFKRDADFRAEDVQQGGLGTCWLDSAISLVATREALTRRLFCEAPFADAQALVAGTAGAAGGSSGASAGAGALASHLAEGPCVPLHPLGIYQVRLFVDGRWRVVTVDDLLPSNGFSGAPAFSAALRRQAWVAVLEKAVAKVSGSYARLVGGQAGQALRLLTGAPVLALFTRTNETQAACARRHSEPGGAGRFAWELRPLQPEPSATLDALWSRLSAYYRAGFLMGASASDSPPFGSFAAAEREGLRAQLRAQGVVLHHSYALLRVLDAAEVGERLLQLRNPWASGRGGQVGKGAGAGAVGPRGWAGAWSDSSAEWARAPQRLRDACAPYGAELGIFWMRLADFAACFQRVDVAKVRGFDP